MTVAIGLWLGIKTEQVALSNDTNVGLPYVAHYPASVDVEPTLNEQARQTVLKGFADKRRAVAQAERKRQQAEGKRKSTLVSISRSDKQDSPTVNYEATAYVALCDTGCSGITATGYDVRNTIYYGNHRIIAVDPAVIALGSLVRITLADGKTFTAVAIDTGGAIDGYRIDLLVSSVSEAQAFGRQRVGIKILRNGAD